MTRNRPGITLIELLIVVLIIAILISLIVPAVFYVRSLSVQIKSKNKLVALFLAAEQRASLNNGKLPTSVQKSSDKAGKGSVHFDIVMYMEGGKNYLEHYYDPSFFPANYSFPAFISPADFTVQLVNNPFMCSYPANAQVFGRDARFPSSFSDGTSNTILFSEHYAACNNVRFLYDTNVYEPTALATRRSTFADGGIPGYPTYGDVYPVSSGASSGTKPSVSGKTFQVQPAFVDCDPSIPQTPHSGLLCGFADGSVRTIGKNISENIFWSLVTMDGREVVSSD